MKKVITFGVFDYFHYGHLKLLERCKALGDFLIVAVHDDKHVKLNKPELKLYYNENERLEMVQAIRFVDEVILYTQIDETIKEVDFDILVVGPDQTNQHFIKAIEYCKANNKKVVELSRTPNISSTEIKKNR